MFPMIVLSDSGCSPFKDSLKRLLKQCIDYCSNNSSDSPLTVPLLVPLMIPLIDSFIVPFEDRHRDASLIGSGPGGRSHEVSGVDCPNARKDS